MNLSRTWVRRLQRTGVIGAAAGVLVMLAGSVLSIWHTAFPAPPIPVPDYARPEYKTVTAFAEHCAETVLMANAATPLGGCANPDRLYKFDPAKTVTTVAAGARTVATRFAGETNGVALWAVKVRVEVRPYAAAPTPVSEFYSLSVAVALSTLAPQVVDKMTPLPPDPPGPVVELAYDAPVGDDSPLRGTLTGFVTALLSGSGDLPLYITTDSGISPRGGYNRDNITIVSLATTTAPPADPRDGTELDARIEVAATRADATRTDQLAVPVTLRALGGKWSVSDINALQAVKEGKPL